MNTKRKILIVLMFASIFTSCSFSLEGIYNTPTYNCAWSNHNSAFFYNPYLLMPCSGGNCEYVFENYLLESTLNPHSLYYIMSKVEEGYVGISFDFNWTVTIASAKTCSVSTDQSNPNSWNQDNYTQVFTVQYQDLYEGTPFVPDSNYIYPSEHKHDFVLQIHDVENTYNGQHGTITWKYTWPQPSVVGSSTWDFIFPNDGVKGTFIPDSYYQTTRHIYYHGQYEDL